MDNALQTYFNPQWSQVPINQPVPQTAPNNYDNWLLSLQNAAMAQPTYAMKTDDYLNYLQNPTGSPSNQAERDIAARMQWGRIPQAWNPYEQYNPFYSAMQNYQMTDAINQMFGRPTDYYGWSEANLPYLRQATPEQMPSQDYMLYRNYLDQILNPGAYQAPPAPKPTVRWRRGFGVYGEGGPGGVNSGPSNSLGTGGGWAGGGLASAAANAMGAEAPDMNDETVGLGDMPSM